MNQYHYYPFYYSILYVRYSSDCAEFSVFSGSGSVSVSWGEFFVNPLLCNNWWIPSVVSYYENKKIRKKRWWKKNGAKKTLKKVGLKNEEVDHVYISGTV